MSAGARGGARPDGTATDFLIGDIHGRLGDLDRLLRQARLVDGEQRWTGGRSRLWFIGDLVDRGPDGIGVIDRVMDLEQQAADAGGMVVSLLGNHEVAFAAAALFGKQDRDFIMRWVSIGGQKQDLDAVTSRHIDWLTALPAMAIVQRALLLHSDTRYYEQYGSTVADVNAQVRRVTQGTDVGRWSRLLGRLNTRGAFQGRKGRRTAKEMLDAFGATRIIHGHTPIHVAEGCAAADVSGPLVYSRGLCMNVDGGLYAGGPGFVVPLEPA